jgi:hypothetical protein
MRWIPVLALPIASGCVGIGVESIGPRNADTGAATVDNISLRWRSNRLTSVTSAGTNLLAELDPLSTDDLIHVLGVPSQRGGNFIRYRTGKRAWRGIAIDLVIFPIPLTIPLILPGGKTGYVDFVSDESGIKVVGYGPLSKFYGFAADDKECGFYWGSQPGFWFNPD